MKTAVLCVHGIQGSPGQFDWIIAALPEDVHVQNLLLSGHGSDMRAFSKSTKEKWQADVAAAMDDLKRDYDRIVYIGHSMGCLLGIDTYLRDPEKIASLILLACPLRVRITYRYIRQNLTAISRRESRDPFVLAARMAHSVHADHLWEYILCVKPYIHLFRLIHSVNRRLDGLNLPVLAVFSEVDEIVGGKSMDVVGKLDCCETYLAHGCGHLYYNPEEKRKIIGKIKNYI